MQKSVFRNETINVEMQKYELTASQRKKKLRQKN